MLHWKHLAFTIAISFFMVQTSSAQTPPRLLPESSSGQDETNGYVAVGELQRIRRDDGTRRLALLNESGEISAFLAPSARVNMRQYVGQTVAVTARSVTRSAGEAAYIIPERITPMTARRPSPNVVADQPIGSGVQQASFLEPLDSVVEPADGEIIDDTAYESWEVLGEEGASFPGVVDEAYVDDAFDGAGVGAIEPNCDGCGFQCGGGCGISNCGPWGRVFVRSEYIAWWTKGMDVPALVTTSDPGTPTSRAGVLGLSTTDILYGQGDILTSSRSGFRIRFGAFLDPCRRLGWEIEYFGLGEEGEIFEASSNGNGSPILARPFFNMNPRVGGDGALSPPPREDSEIVAYPGVLSGVVTVDSRTSVDSAAGRFRWNFCCKKLSCGNACVGCRHPQGFSRVDITAGYRYFELDDSIQINEDLTSLQAVNPGRFQLFDQFTSENQFNGGELGFLWEGGWRNLTLELASRVAVGNVHQRVTIAGGTTISPLTQPQQSYEGGLLAQRTNIGEYSNDDFGMFNELGLTLGLYLTPRLRATVGYTLIYLSPVVRAGEQIDLDVNPDLLAPEMQPFTGPERPQFAFQETNFWANGVNVGLDLRW